MKFKCALAVLIAISAMVTTVNAAGIRTEVDGTTITVTVATDADCKANILVAKKGTNIRDNANLYEMAQVQADGEGKITHIFTIPEFRNSISSYGEYEVFVKPEDGEMLTGEFTFATESDIAELVTALTAQDADYAAIFAESSPYRISLKAIGCLMDSYDALDDKTGVITTFASGITAGSDGTDIVSLLNGAITIENIRDAASADVALELYSPKFNEKNYLNFDNKRKEYVVATICGYLPFESPADFNAKYEKVNALYEVNIARFDKMSDVLDEYKTILGIAGKDAYQNYLGLSYSKKVTANEELASIFKKGYVTTTAGLCEAIDSAYEKANKKSGTTTGGSGGGGGTGFISPGPEVITPNPDAPGNIISGEFNDLDSVSWAKEAILALKEKGIVSGTGNGQFSPNDTVTREAFTKMIVMASGLYKPGETAEFDDISSDDWCYSYVASAFNNKLVYGISETSFGKGSNISRQDMAVIAYRAAKDSGRMNKGREMTTFSDANLISDYAQEAIEALYTTGVLNGSDGQLRPLSTATRAEASVIIYNLFVK